MDKQQLLDEIERLKAQVEQLQEPKTGRVLSLGGFEEGYTVQGTRRTVEVTKNYVLLDFYFETGHLFYDKESAEKYVRYLKLWQRARQFMADDWRGEVVDWADTNQRKHTIVLFGSNIELDEVCHQFSPLHFRLHTSRKRFLEQFSSGDIKLILMGV